MENKYPEYIMKKVRQMMNLDENDTSKDKEINSLFKQEVFERVLNWEGIIGYSHSLNSWIQDIFGIDLRIEEIEHQSPSHVKDSCQQIMKGIKVETFVEDLGEILSQLFVDADLEFHVDVFASQEITWIQQKTKPEFEFSYEPDTKITNIKIKGERFITWGFKIIDLEEYGHLKSALEIGKRICLHDEPKIGKLLLVNFEDEGFNVMDSLVDILDYITEQWKNVHNG